MRGKHLEILVAEPSTELFLRALLPKLLGKNISFDVHAFQCKVELLNKLPARLESYAHWLPKDWRIVVLVEQNNDEHKALKRRIEKMVVAAGLHNRSPAPAAIWQIAICFAIEELEAWYFGDWEAVRAVYPHVPEDIPKQSNYRNPDGITGGTRDAFEQVLKRADYCKNGLRKMEIARAVGGKVKPARNQSPSFQAFCETIVEATSLIRNKAGKS